VRSVRSAFLVVKNTLITSLESVKGAEPVSSPAFVPESCPVFCVFYATAWLYTQFTYHRCVPSLYTMTPVLLHHDNMHLRTQVVMLLKSIKDKPEPKAEAQPAAPPAPAPQAPPAPPEAAPVAPAPAPVAPAPEPVAPQATPVVPEPAPVVPEAAPVAPEAAPVASQAAAPTEAAPPAPTAGAS
jgi:hypothetical protein